MFCIDELKRKLHVDTIISNQTEKTQHFAAVSLILKPCENGFDVLFIRRAINERDPWSGHIGLPGGRVETSDSDHKVTSIRETQEELGFDLHEHDYIGYVDTYDALRSDLSYTMNISLFVYVLKSEPELHLDPKEVSSVVWAPMSYLHDTERQINYTAPSGNIFDGIYLGKGNYRKEKGDVLWGLTLRMVLGFLKVLD